ALPHLLRPRSWTKPWRTPTFEQSRRWIANTQTEDIAREIYDGLVHESGRYAQFRDRYRDMAKRLGFEGAYRLGRSDAVKARFSSPDHMGFSGAALPVTMSYIDDWMTRNHVLGG